MLFKIYLHIWIFMQSSKLIVHAGGKKKKKGTDIKACLKTTTAPLSTKSISEKKDHLSPPRISAVFSPVNLPSWETTNTQSWTGNHSIITKTSLVCGFVFTSLVNFMVCNASSLVGVRIRALAPVWAWGPFNLSNMGTKNAAVFPLPVLAMATTSLPSRMTGIVCHNKNNCHEKVTRKERVMSEDTEVTDFSLDRGWNVVAFLHDAFIDRVAETCAVAKNSQDFIAKERRKSRGGLQIDIPMDWKPPDFFFFLFWARTISLVSGSTSDRQSEDVGKRGSFLATCQETNNYLFIYHFYFSSPSSSVYKSSSQLCSCCSWCS